jgi:hypothetical protein
VEGALVEEGASVVGRTSTHQIAVRLVAEGGHLAELHSCGGVSRSELTVCFWSSFSGFESLYVGRTFLEHTWFFWTCISVQIRLLLYQVHLYFVLAVFHLLLSSYINIYSKLVFPGGFLLEYIRWCARFTTTIPSSPNHRPKPPSEHLNLDLRIPLKANPRLDSQTKSNASLPKDSASQKDDQIVQTLAKRYPSQILKLAAAAAAPTTLLQTCAPATPAVRTNWENCSPEM